MLELKRQEVFVDSINTRAEKHGEETKVAFDAFVRIDVQNTVLGLFDPNLLAALFCKGDSPQGELIEDASYLPALRFPKLAALKWGEKFPGYRVGFFTEGLFGDNGVEMIDVELDKFSFEPKEGGSVSLRFRAILHPSAEQMAPLLSLIQQKCELSLEAPAPPAALEVAAGDLLKAEGSEERSEFADAAAAAIQKHKDGRKDARPAGGRPAH